MKDAIIKWGRIRTQKTPNSGVERVNMEESDFINYLLMCNKLLHKLVSKTTNIYHLRVSLGQKSLKWLAGLFWLKVFMRFQSKGSTTGGFSPKFLGGSLATS